MEGDDARKAFDDLQYTEAIIFYDGYSNSIEGVSCVGKVSADEIDRNLTVQMNVMESLGIHHIEMRGVNGKNLCDCTLEEAKEIKAQLEGTAVQGPTARTISWTLPMPLALAMALTSLPER